MDTVTRIVARMLAPLKLQLRLVVTRAVIHLVNDSPGIQLLQVSALAGEVLEDVERFQEYGLSSVPHSGAEAIQLNVGADRSHPIVIAVEDRRYRMRPLADGEVALHDDLGQCVHLKRNGVELHGQNVLIRTEGILRMEGNGIELAASTYLQSEVHGYGERKTWLGGTAYHTDLYSLTPSADTSANLPLGDPALDSDHPEVS